LAVPRYVIHRDLGDITDAQLDAAAKESERLRLSDFPEIGWEHSHVVRVPGGLRSYCIYSAPDEQTIRAHAARAGLPVDHIREIHVDIVPSALA
jgi:muconolactone delta-isomerase